MEIVTQNMRFRQTLMKYAEKNGCAQTHNPELFSEREIICKRYGIPDKDGSLCKPMPQREIAKQMGISRSYISRIEKRAYQAQKEVYRG